MDRKRSRQALRDKVEPCDICGDVGFGEVIVTCSKCKLTREHVYCMRCNLMEASRRQHSVGKGPLGKVKYLDVDEVIKLSSSKVSMKPTPPRSSLPMSRMASQGSSNFLMTRRDIFASKSVIPKNPSLTRKPNPSISPMAHPKFPRNGVQKNSMTDQRASPSTGDTVNGFGKKVHNHDLDCVT
ncbi:hypothetical protein QL285_064035 [Trifolium repens]|nr:hypothetical protein QL285_064035 [Trifolium repens]